MTEEHYGPHPAFGFLTKHVGPREERSGPDCGPDIDPFADPDGDDTRREDEPGPWFIAGFDDECSRGGEPIDSGDTIRADGDGGWECRECVDADQIKDTGCLWCRQCASCDCGLPMSCTCGGCTCGVPCPHPRCEAAAA